MLVKDTITWEGKILKREVLDATAQADLNPLVEMMTDKFEKEIKKNENNENQN